MSIIIFFVLKWLILPPLFDKTSVRYIQEYMILNIFFHWEIM